MTRSHYLRFAAEQALSTGQPLGHVLRQVLVPVGGPLPQERQAIAAAEGGRLEKALTLLGFDRVSIEAATMDPAQAFEVGQRMRRLTTNEVLRRKLAESLRYATIVLTVQIGCSVVLSLYVVPVLLQFLAGQPVPFATRCLSAFGRVGAPHQLSALAAVVAAGAVWQWLMRRETWQLEGARVCAAASALVAGGASSESVLPQLQRAVRPHRKIDQRLGGATLDAASLDRLARTFVLDAEQRTQRLARLFEYGSVCVVAIFGGLLIWGVYGVLPLIPDGAWSPGR